MSDLVNFGVVTWIGTSCAPRRYVVPAISIYSPFHLAEHTLIVDISPQSEHIPDSNRSAPAENAKLFFECLKMIVRENSQMHPRVDVLRVECANRDIWPSRCIWAVLGALRPLHLEVVLGGPQMLSLPRFSSLHPQVFTLKRQRNLAPDLPDWRYNLKYGTPQLFGSVCGLEIVHPLAFDMFIKLCDENPGLATQLNYLRLLSTQLAGVPRKRTSQEFGVALSRCTSLADLALTVSNHDVDVAFCRMLPSYLSNTLVNLRIQGPPHMARYCQRWIQCARTKTWLPSLKSLVCHLAYHENATSDQENDRFKLAVHSKALAWTKRFVNAMVEHRPDLEILH